MLTRFTLIRHAHTASNDRNTARLIGRTDVPLTARGREEIVRLGERLRGHPPFDAIYTSPLMRARETATALDELRLGPLHLCEGLQEIDCGELDGAVADEVRHRFPALWAANMRQDDDGFRWPGGESYREFRARCLRTVHRLALAHRDRHVALVTHAGVIGQLVGWSRGAGAARWELYRPANASLSELVWGHGLALVTSFDDRAHLQPDEGPWQLLEARAAQLQK